MRMGIKHKRIMCGLMVDMTDTAAPTIPKWSLQYPRIIPKTRSIGV